MIKSKIAWLEFEWEEPSDKEVASEKDWVTRNPQTAARFLLLNRARLAGIEQASKEEHEHE